MSPYTSDVGSHRFKSAVDLAASRNLFLSEDEVHIWSASLQRYSGDLAQLLKTLDQYELRRAFQFRFVRDRTQFVFARGLLRHILSLYVHKDPARIELWNTACGKPEIRERSRTGRQYVRFNYSHSDGIAVYAIARDRRVGIDVERVQDITAESIAGHFFCASEIAALRSLPASQQTEAFFQCWTRKEAYIKARGEGCRIPLDSFEVFPETDGSVVITDDENFPWSLQSFVPAPGCVAAVAVEGQRVDIGFVDHQQSHRHVPQTRTGLLPGR